MGPGYLWTLRRVYPLLGQTLPERQASDLLAAVAILRRESADGPVRCSAKASPPRWPSMPRCHLQISEVVLADPPQSHTDPQTPEFLGILRIGDLPQTCSFIRVRSPSWCCSRRV